jgi:hypothetical protein
MFCFILCYFTAQQTNGERLRILIKDDDVDVNDATYTFDIKEANETPKGMIAFEEADPTNKERWLHIVATVDRESEEIKKLDGILTYILTVVDSGKNENYKEVRLYYLQKFVYFLI